MVIDTGLCLILLAMIGWVAFGCHATRSQPIQQRHDERPRDHIDRAA